jgi:hypothetical protein
VLRSVTRSTTEAELYALLAASVESQYWDRFCRNIGFLLHTKKALWYDNAQTVRLVQGDTDRIQTKLRYIDIHQMWLRQEVDSGRITVEWKPTALMPADGFTKLLPRQKHENLSRFWSLFSLYHVPQFHVSTAVPRSTSHTTGLHHTAVPLHILSIVTFNTNSVQSFNSSCICAVFTPRQNFMRQLGLKDTYHLIVKDSPSPIPLEQLD